MKLKVVVLLVATGSAIGLLFQSGGAGAVASDPACMAAGPLAMMTVAGTDFEYVGSKKCKLCHLKVYKSWQETTHGKAFDTLKPGNASEAKQKHGLDPAKDYSTDESCLACHTVGYGKPGGYAVPDAADAKAVKKMAALAGVGCEACHGPGSEYNKLKKTIKKEKRKYKFEELAAVGMNKIEECTCTACHNGKGPTYDESKPFDFAKMKENTKGIHAHEELKLRED